MADYTVPLFINGKDVITEKTFEVTSPATGKVVHKCSSATVAEAQAATDAAVASFKDWRDTTPRKRRDILLKAADIMEKRTQELSGYMVDETGCPPQWAEFNLSNARDMIIDVAGRISSLEGSIPTPGDPSIGALVVKEPYGAVLAIAPW